MKKYLFVLCCLLSNMIAFPVKADSSLSVVINEIAWAGTVASANDEWIELYNNSNEDIDLSGWNLSATDGQPAVSLSGKISSHGFFLLERTDDTTVNNITADMIYSGSLSNTGEKLILKNGNSEVVDVVDCTSGWFAGDNASKASMERGDSAVTGHQDNWRTNDGVTKNGNDANNSALSATPRAANSNGVTSSTLSTQASTTTSQLQPSSNQTHYKFGSVSINELLVDPGDDENEWIELFSSSNEQISLSGWTVEDGVGTKSNLTGQIGGSAGKFAVIDSPSGSLNNAGDRVVLRDSFGTIIDFVTYGDWDDGSKTDNAPTAADSDAIARKIDGLNSLNNKEDFVVTRSATKGKENIIETEESGRKDYGGLIFSEIFPNPFGDDSVKEFIELFNQSDQDINLLGWRISDDSGAKYRLATSTFLVPAGNFFVLFRSVSRIALNNAGGSLKLFAPDSEKPVQSLKYEDAPEGQSYGLIQGVWEWSASTTAGRENFFKGNNIPPIVRFDCPKNVAAGTRIIFDSSDTFDLNDDKLNFYWDFGDGFRSRLVSPDHSFLEGGKYKVSLEVGDGVASSSKECQIEISRGGSDKQDKDKKVASSGRSIKVVLNEVLPNPKRGQNEWVELKNLETKRVNLSGWSLDDAEGGSHPYIFAENFWLEAGGYKVVDQSQSGISLNNGGDVVRLFDPNGESIDEVVFPKAKPGIPWARSDNDEYVWTEKLTPGGDNIFSAMKTVELIKINRKSSSNPADYHPSDLRDVDDWQVGDKLIVRGVVTVEPGMLGSQIFYIAGSPGVEIYNYKKDFPKLAIGDFVEVHGELTLSGDTKRLKTKNSSDVKVIEHQEAPVASTCACQQVDDYQNTQLIQINGEVTDKKGATIYVDDGTAEVAVYLKKSTGILPADIDEGEMITVSGLLMRNKSGQKILPRRQSDVVILGRNEDKKSQLQAVGEVSTSTNWAIPVRDKKSELFDYLMIMAVGALVLLSWFYFKNRS